MEVQKRRRKRKEQNQCMQTPVQWDRRLLQLSPPAQPPREATLYVSQLQIVLFEDEFATELGQKMLIGEHPPLDFSLDFPLPRPLITWFMVMSYTSLVLVGLCCSKSLLQSSGGFRNLERGVQPLACKAHLKMFKFPRPLLVMWKSELNISKQH